MKILALIGNLSFSWSNNESMFIYVLMNLLETDLEAAAITFTTLNTTRARLDLIRRLAKSKIKDPALIKRIEKLIDRFNKCTKVRNEFNHCIYHISDEGEFTHATLLRISEEKDSVRVGTVVRFDDARIREIVETSNRLKTINRDLWTLLPDLEKYMSSQHDAKHSNNSLRQ